MFNLLIVLPQSGMMNTARFLSPPQSTQHHGALSFVFLANITTRALAATTKSMLATTLTTYQYL